MFLHVPRHQGILSGEETDQIRARMQVVFGPTVQRATPVGTASLIAHVVAAVSDAAPIAWMAGPVRRREASNASHGAGAALKEV